jgi:hypothetical protein
MFKIPEKIKIGCYNYTVKITNEPIIIGDICNYAGSIDYEKKSILIKKDMEESLQKQVLWHEIIHGILEYFNYYLDFKTDKHHEEMIEIVSKGLLMVISDNSSLLQGSV